MSTQELQFAPFAHGTGDQPLLVHAVHPAPPVNVDEPIDVAVL